MHAKDNWHPPKVLSYTFALHKVTFTLTDTEELKTATRSKSEISKWAANDKQYTHCTHYISQ